ncbi:MAG TPA: Rrf2 family transcriptional regulator [Tepidisphaeraceae bacterium]
MKLSKRAEYGLRAIVQLARLSPTVYVQAKDLAQQEDLPAKFLEAILLTLRRGDFLESKVGAGGGYRLSRPARQILLGDILRSLEGRLTTSNPIPAGEQSPGKLAVHLINQKLSDSTDDVLDSMTLEQLLDQISRAAGAQEMYYI